MGNESECEQTNRLNREAVLGRFICSVLQWFTGIVCPALLFIPHEPTKKTLIPYTNVFTMLPSKTLSKIHREKL